MGIISGGYERIKNLWGLASNPRRYRSEEQTDIDEVVTPNEWRDQTRPGWGERIKSRKVTVMTWGFIAFIALLIVAAHSRTYIPELYGNPWIQEAIKWLVALPTTWILATKWQRDKIAKLDSLNLKIGDSAKSYDGVLDTDAEGNHVFTPIKGWSFLGMKGNQMTLGDLSNDFAENFAKVGRDADDPVKIRLEDALYAVTDTALGKEAVCLTDGLVIDGHGRHSDLYTSPPEIADEDAYKALGKKVEQVVEQNQHLSEKLDLVTQQRDELKTEVKEAREAGENRVLNIIERTGEAGVYKSAGGRRTTTGPSSNGQTPEAN